MKCDKDGTEMIVEGRLGYLKYQKDACYCCPTCGKVIPMFKGRIFK